MKYPLLALAVMAGSGCAAILDSAYRLGDGKYRESAEESAPTAQIVDRLEYETRLQPDQSLRLECVARTRQVERSWSVTKTFEYRGGFRKNVYWGSAVADGVIGALLAGPLLGVCTKEDSDTSCYHMLWASPFAIDLLYSLIRTRMVRDPVLVGKRRSADQVRFAQVPVEEEVATCPSTQLWLGGASGPSEEDLLNGRGGGEARELGPDAVRVVVDAEGLVTLSAEVVAHWVGRSYATLWVSDDRVGLQPVLVDRCGALRPHASTLTFDQRQSFDRDCPLPQPQQ